MYCLPRLALWQKADRESEFKETASLQQRTQSRRPVRCSTHVVFTSSQRASTPFFSRLFFSSSRYAWTSFSKRRKVMRKHKYTLQRNNKMENEKKKRICAHTQKRVIYTLSLKSAKRFYFWEQQRKKARLADTVRANWYRTLLPHYCCSANASFPRRIFFYGGSLPFFTDKTEVKTHRKKRRVLYIHTHKKKHMHTLKIALS